MEHLIEISPEQRKMVFVATCIETTARRLGVDYKVIFDRMKRVGMIEQYILPNYEVLHAESREHVVDDMIECLTNWEAKQ